MAKSRQEWETVFSNYAISRGLSSSAEADWLELRNTIITIVMFFEVIIDLFKSDVNDVIDNKQYGSIYWWPTMVAAYQHGDNLLVANGKPYYEVIDPAKQIAFKRSVTTGESGIMNIKAARNDGSGLPTQFTQDEIDGMRNYIKRRQPPGVLWNFYSLPNDVIKYILSIRYDPAYNKALLETAINDALDAFRLDFDFENSMFYKSQLIAKLQAVPGVKSVVITINMVLNNGTEIVNNVLDEKELPAGFFIWDNTSTKTFIAI